ncbi:MAG: alpha/beta hydrolase [Chloroflexi bacterium]|nr:alpha/beta hydrolase [Chloroflexota bacterium]
MTDYPLYDFGGEGTPLVLSLANGFPPETYRHLLEPFTADYHVICVLPRALWPDAPSPDSLDSWRDMAADLRAAIHAHGLAGGVGAGHSMGGVATMLATISEPDLFRSIVLLDPTLLPPSYLIPMAVLNVFGMSHRAPVVERASRRRSSFDSEQEAFDYWRGKSLFADWSDETLWAYVHGITTPNGSGVELRWSPQWEARYFAKVPTWIWREMPKLRNLLPMLFIQGDETNAFVEHSFRRIQRLVPEADYAQINGHGHLFPQSAPQQAADIMRAWLADYG